MNEFNTTENQTKNPFFQIIFDACLVAAFSFGVLSLYENYVTNIHSSKENMLAISFDMFSLYYTFIVLFLVLIVPNLFEIIINRRNIYRYKEEKRIASKLVRVLKIILSTLFIVLCLITFADKYSRVEFYSDGTIVEYDRNNQVERKYSKSDVDYVELRTNHVSGKNYWTEAIIYINDYKFILKTENYIVPDNDEYIFYTDRNLYGLRSTKKVFSDKIKINSENIDTLLRVEFPYYNREQAEELCEIFESDYNEIAIWLEEEWGLVL